MRDRKKFNRHRNQYAHLRAPGHGNDLLPPTYTFTGFRMGTESRSQLSWNDLSRFAIILLAELLRSTSWRLVVPVGRTLLAFGLECFRLPYPEQSQRPPGEPATSTW